MHTVAAAIRRDTGFKIAQSLVFNDPDSRYLTRGVTADGNRTAFTFSFWAKKNNEAGNTGNQNIFVGNGGNDSDNRDFLRFAGSDRLQSRTLELGAIKQDKVTTENLKDSSAWMHILWVWDTNNGNNSDRIRLYKDNVRFVDFDSSSNPSSGYGSRRINRSSRDMSIGRDLSSVGAEADFYMAEVVFLDGSVLDPSSFGEDDGNGNWVPIDVSGLDYTGVNSFHLDFSDPNNIGNDVSGNGIHYTPVNFLSSHVVTDSPTNNIATIDSSRVSTLALDGNRLWTRGGADYIHLTTAIMGSGKWYFEAKVESNPSSDMRVGVFKVGSYESSRLGDQADCYGYRSDGTTRFNGGSAAYGDIWQTVGDVIGVAFNNIDMTIEYFKNGVSQGVANTGLPVGDYYFSWSGDITDVNLFMRFNSDNFTYAPPAGFKELKN